MSVFWRNNVLIDFFVTQYHCTTCDGHASRFELEIFPHKIVLMLKRIIIDRGSDDNEEAGGYETTRMLPILFLSKEPDQY